MNNVIAPYWDILPRLGMQFIMHTLTIVEITSLDVFATNCRGKFWFKSYNDIPKNPLPIFSPLDNNIMNIIKLKQFKKKYVIKKYPINIINMKRKVKALLWARLYNVNNVFVLKGTGL